MRYLNDEKLKAQLFTAYPLIKRDRLEAVIDAVPSCDVRPVVHGFWTDVEGLLICSECGHATEDIILEHTMHKSAINGDEVVMQVEKYPYYCGRCGATMDK